jgi:predicted ATP-grasp superfamily ATP-dependent carboligase
MSLKQYIYALVDNILAQVNADQRRKAAYTAQYIQSMLVAHINALAETGVIVDDNATSASAWELLSEKLKLAGWVDIEAGLDPEGAGAYKLSSVESFPWELA